MLILSATPCVLHACRYHAYYFDIFPIDADVSMIIAFERRFRYRFFFTCQRHDAFYMPRYVDMLLRAVIAASAAALMSLLLRRAVCCCYDTA